MESMFPYKLTHSEISVAVSILPKELEFYEDVLRDLHFPSRVHVSTLKTKGYWFPINELRNIAIEASTTTHIFVSDADILPSCTRFSPPPYKRISARPSFPFPTSCSAIRIMP